MVCQIVQQLTNSNVDEIINILILLLLRIHQMFYLKIFKGLKIEYKIHLMLFLMEFQGIQVISNN